jgi:hypothetical protein
MLALKTGAACCILALAALARPLTAEELADLKPSHPAYEAVQKALAAGLLRATEGNFSGAAPFSRYDTAWLLGKTLALTGVPAPPAMEASPFSDVPADHWAHAEIRRSVEGGILQGFEGKFMGEKSINRYQLAVILQKLFERIGSPLDGGNSGPALADLPKEHWAHEAARGCVAQGILGPFDDGDYEGFHGVKIVSRFHMARVAGKVLDRIQWTPDLTRIVKAPGAKPAMDLKKIEATAIEWADELALINVHVTTLTEAAAEYRKNPSPATRDNLMEKCAAHIRRCAAMESQLAEMKKVFDQMKSDAPLPQATRNLKALVTEFGDEMTFLKGKLGTLKESLEK